ncbi:hypothetical protein C5167_017254 [Papaver somniferum]|uniref:Uncharacterized protein n=1 Tax=Papaver somniferum TaxID=3469 RepID=A0A4Y7IM70_PAPSO|nr:hypothetical protein C5167_017254 [Papaver somniferum]
MGLIRSPIRPTYPSASFRLRVDDLDSDIYSENSNSPSLALLVVDQYGSNFKDDEVHESGSLEMIMNTAPTKNQSTKKQEMDSKCVLVRAVFSRKS